MAQAVAEAPAWLEQLRSEASQRGSTRKVLICKTHTRDHDEAGPSRPRVGPVSDLVAFVPGFNPEEQYILSDRRLLVETWYDKATGKIVGGVLFAHGAGGPPGHAHGGAQSAVLDDTLGSVVWNDGWNAVTGQLHVSLKRRLPLETWVRVDARVTGSSGRKINAAASLSDGVTGDAFSEATALFVADKNQPRRAKL
eukprot:tig00021603_g22812.t1